jgi:hypothetical protein
MSGGEFSPPLVFGNCFHEVMERVYDSCEALPSRKRIHTCISDWANTNLPNCPPRQLEESQKWIALAEITAIGYFNKWLGDFKTDWISTEQKVDFPYTYPDGQTTKLIGYIDLLGRSAKSTKLEVFDTKTKGEINEEDLLAEMPVNFQFNLYLCYVRWKYSECPGRAVMNIVRRPGHRQKSNESLKEFVERVETEIYKRPEHFYKRVPYDILDSDLDWWWDTQLTPIMEDIRSWQDRGFPAYVNPTGLRIGRRKSDYFDALTQGDFTKLSRRK